jgi:hypothetical protein
MECVVVAWVAKGRVSPGERNMHDSAGQGATKSVHADAKTFLVPVGALGVVHLLPPLQITSFG